MSKGNKSSADDNGYLTEEYINRLHILSKAIESNDEATVNTLVAELTTLRESALYQELGMLTREIHETINAFGHDERIATLATEDIPDAKERLSFIVTKTDQAAHRTMNAAEETMTVLDSVSGRALDFRARWTKFRNRELSRQEFVQLSDELDSFFDAIGPDTQKISSKMTEIMLAQDYQDITGQMIKQVVTMVQEVEEKLVRLVAISGQGMTDKVKQKVDGEIAEGPQLPNANKKEVATNQGDVDDLLASLGF